MTTFDYIFFRLKPLFGTNVRFWSYFVGYLFLAKLSTDIYEAFKQGFLSNTLIWLAVDVRFHRRLIAEILKPDLIGNSMVFRDLIGRWPYWAKGGDSRSVLEAGRRQWQHSKVEVTKVLLNTKAEIIDLELNYDENWTLSHMHRHFVSKLTARSKKYSISDVILSSVKVRLPRPLFGHGVKPNLFGACWEPTQLNDRCVFDTEIKVYGIYPVSH